MKPFIDDDEYIMLVHENKMRRVSPDDLKRLREIGVKTSIEYLGWQDVAREDGSFDWSWIESIVEPLLQADIKVLLGVSWDHGPRWFPKDWYLHDATGNLFTGWCYEYVVSPWCPPVVEKLSEFIKAVCDRWSSEQVLCYRGAIHGGEVMYPETPDWVPSYFDPWAIQDFQAYYGSQAKPTYPPDEATNAWLYGTSRQMLLREQAIFYKYRPELWTAMHYAFGVQLYTGNQHQRLLYGDMRKAFPEMDHQTICFTYFEPVQGLDKFREDARNGMKIWSGSEYCEGLLQNTDAAIAAGFRGFITGPVHYWTKHKVMEPWMFEAFAISLAKWRNAREVHPAV